MAKVTWKILGPELQEKLRKKYIRVLNERGVVGTSCKKPIIYRDGKGSE